MSRATEQYEHTLPNTSDLEGDNFFAKASRTYWRAGAVSSDLPKFSAKAIEEIHDELERSSIPFKSLLILENLQYLERYLWPNFGEDSSDKHVVSISLMITAKRRQNVEIWGLFASSSERFMVLFRRVLTMLIAPSMPIRIQQHLLSFISCAFQSLDSALVRKACAPLVSIGLWHHLHSDGAREAIFTDHPLLHKAWRASNKKYNASNDGVKMNLKFEWSWLPMMIFNFLNLAYSSTNEFQEERVLYSERFLELLTDLVSQAPTRRHVNALLWDIQLIVAVQLSPIFLDQRNQLLRALLELLERFMRIPIDEETGVQLTPDVRQLRHHDAIARLQRIALKNYKRKLTILALSNLGALSDRKELSTHLEALDESEMHGLCLDLGLRIGYPESVKLRVDRTFLLEALLSKFTQSQSFEDIVQESTVLPTERCLYEHSLLSTESYRGERPLALPKINLQYLSVKDFLCRSYILFRAESFFDVRRDIEDSISRLYPGLKKRDRGANHRGSMKMALPISGLSILEVAPAKVGEESPAYVRAEVELPLESMSDEVRRGWEELRPDDVIFFVNVDTQSYPSRSNTDTFRTRPTNGETPRINAIRSAEIVSIFDKAGNAIYNSGGQYRQNRKLHVKLDGKTYQMDKAKDQNNENDVYASLNIVVRRKGIENNFKAVLDSIRLLLDSEMPIPQWLLDVFLGYGDPWRAHYSKLDFRPKSVDFVDTFLDWEHLMSCFPGRIGQDQHCDPPYVLAQDASVIRSKKSKKKPRYDDFAPENAPFKVSSYKTSNRGPYPMDVPKKNAIRFTAQQAKAIYSGTNPGLTIIVGPPGTGKTDVACQIISNIYHNFPLQRTLLVAHSNQALNQLFQKIAALDIDRRHLLRLGHGEDGLTTEASFSKSGRVESFMENRAHLLALVDRLALAIGAPGAHGNSCETAGYFFKVYVQPAWHKYLEILDDESSAKVLIEKFPFLSYFSDTPHKIFHAELTASEVADIAKGCFSHIERLFKELEDILPFEVLRNSRDKANYLLVKEARIVAMTSTHAAIKRNEIVKLGFKYDNVVMEEAAQITEIETFIPLTLQLSKDAKIPLQRLVLCGDHYQNSPIVQNIALRQFSNFDQSMFARMVRLGVPTINLDKQGRARPSIAELYSWRYEGLGNLDSIEKSAEFGMANAGFKHEYQFINVDDFKGQGETEPIPHFIQNLGEAEYAVALYQYMRLLGYPANKISILTTYAGQRQLIKDVLYRRCSKNPLFGMPSFVTTVDKYQGEQNDYVILSLVRTKRVGYLRDIRRLTVALSRARLGLYILGRRNVFENCYELATPFKLLLSKPDSLDLVSGEMWPASRKLGDTAEAIKMENVEHLGQYVFEMTNARVQALKNQANSK